MKNYSNKGKWYWTAASEKLLYLNALLLQPQIEKLKKKKACVYCQEFPKHCILLKLKKTVHTGGWLWVFFGVMSLLEKIYYEEIMAELIQMWPTEHFE